MPDTARALFRPGDRTITVRRGTTVLDAIRQAGIPFESICGGKGECGKCRVIAVAGSSTAGSPESIKGLTDEEVRRHYCRACQTFVTGDCEFALPIESRIDSPRILLTRADTRTPRMPAVAKYLVRPMPENHGPAVHRSLRLEGYTGPRPHMTREQHDELVALHETATVTLSSANGYPEVIRIEDGDTRRHLYGVAIDLGTTTVAGLLADLTDGTVIAEASCLNRQIPYGEELLTRIAHAKTPGGTQALQEAAAGSINEVMDNLGSAAGTDTTAIADLCIAGNTVMSTLLLGRETRALEQPGADIARDPVVMKAAALGLEAGPGAYTFILPAVSRFVGGDAVGDVIAGGIPCQQELSLIIDLGTNGEIMLGSAAWLASVSCASGPAFEGAGISSGMRAMRGAIDHVRIDPASCTVSYTTIRDEPPRGICGSGIIDAAAAMMAAGILDFTGKLVEGKPGVRPAASGLEFVLVPRETTATGRDICITDQDMLYLMDSKAAVCGAIGVLLKKYRVRVQDVRHVYLAGAFGAFSDMKSVVSFGIIPDFRGAQFHGIGNGSLAGALACLLSQDMRRTAREIGRQMVYIDLLVDVDFIEEYTAALHIPGKREYFS